MSPLGLAAAAGARDIAPQQLAAEWTKQSPMRRFATAEECAHMPPFLSSSESSAMTGQALNVTASALTT